MATKQLAKCRSRWGEVAILAVVVSLSLVRSVITSYRPSASDLSVAKQPASPPVAKEMPSCGLEIAEKPIWKEHKVRGDKWIPFASAIGVLDSIEAEYFLDYGTLLGFVRECRNFDLDYDFSLSIDWLKKDGNLKRLKDAFELAGFEIQKPGRTSNLSNDRMTIDGDSMFKVSLNGYEMDFFFAYMGVEGQVENAMYYRGLNSCPRQIEGIEIFRWNDLYVRIPVPYDDFLRASYGDDYMTPRRIRFRKLAQETLRAGRCLMTTEAIATNDAGLLVCLDDEKSINEALVLVENLREWGRGGNVQLEIHHKDLLSPHLREQFERYDNVKLENLSSSLKRNATAEDLYAAALKQTKLKRILVVRPSTIFLQRPMDILGTMRFQTKWPVETPCKNGAPCVQAIESDFTKSLAQGSPFATITTFPSKSHPTAFLQVDNSTLLSVATIHETGHRVGLFASPSRDYLDWITDNEYSEDLFSLRRQSSPSHISDLPLAYRKHLRDHWKRYKVIKRSMDKQR